jgi:hypothetical protein
MNDRCIIYGRIDPRTRLIRYVGKSAMRAGTRVQTVALRYGVSPRAIRDVMNGRRWKEVAMEMGGQS